MRKKDFERIKNKLREINSQVLREQVLKTSRKFIMGKDVKGNPRELLHHQCATCLNWYRPEKVEIDHIDEIGSVKFDKSGTGKKYGDITNVDWSFIDRMFCELSNCQILCVKCHQKKTHSFNGGLRRKNMRDEDLL